MLRINLLPAYFAERRKTRLAIVGFSVGFLAVTAAMLGWFFVQKHNTEALEAQASAEADKAAQVVAIQTEATGIRAKVQPIKDKEEFVKAVLFQNSLRSRIFRQAAAYTYRDVEYRSMVIAGNTLNVQASSKRVSDIGRYLITMFGNPDLTAVSISGIPGWPPGNTSGGAGGGGGGGYPGMGGGGGGGYPGAGGGGGGFPGAGGALAQTPRKYGRCVHSRGDADKTRDAPGASGQRDRRRRCSGWSWRWWRLSRHGWSSWRWLPRHGRWQRLPWCRRAAPGPCC